jgi:hypothetical protein
MQAVHVRDEFVYERLGSSFEVHIRNEELSVSDTGIGGLETLLTPGLVQADSDVRGGSYWLGDVGGDVDFLLGDYLSTSDVDTIVTVVSNLRKNDTTGFLEFKTRPLVVRSAGAESGWSALDFD